MTFHKKQNYWAGYKANKKALIIQIWSGSGIIMDYLYLPHILPLDTDNETLGSVVLQALANSRNPIYDSPEDKELHDITQRKPRYDAWVSYLCEQMGYKTKRALFKNMMSCSVRLNNKQIKISSSRHVKLEAWEGMKNVDDVILSLNNTPEEIGAGLRLALSCCR